jgi:hypothetical protein
MISITVNSQLSGIRGSGILIELAKISNEIYHFHEVTSKTKF